MSERNFWTEERINIFDNLFKKVDEKAKQIFKEKGCEECLTGFDNKLYYMFYNLLRFLH